MDKIKGAETKDTAENGIVKIKKESDDLSVQLSNFPTFQTCERVTEHEVKVQVLKKIQCKINTQTENTMNSQNAQFTHRYLKRVEQDIDYLCNFFKLSQDSIAKLKANGWDAKYILPRLSRKEMDQMGINRTGEQAKIESMGAFVDDDIAFNAAPQTNLRGPSGGFYESSTGFQGGYYDDQYMFPHVSNLSPSPFSHFSESPQPTTASVPSISRINSEASASSSTSHANTRPEEVGEVIPFPSSLTPPTNPRPEVPLKKVFEKMRKQDQLELIADIIDRKKHVGEFNGEELDDFATGKDEDPTIWVLRFTFHMSRFDCELAVMCALLFETHASRRFDGLQNSCRKWCYEKAHNKRFRYKQCQHKEL